MSRDDRAFLEDILDRLHRRNVTRGVEITCDGGTGWALETARAAGN